jgi:hypothetical protein
MRPSSTRRAARQPDHPGPGTAALHPPHANADLFTWASKLGPLAPGALLLDCFELARDIRTLDMQASPYDVSSLGEHAVAIETPEGKAECVARQRMFAERATSVRTRLVAACEVLGRTSAE